MKQQPGIRFKGTKSTKGIVAKKKRLSVGSSLERITPKGDTVVEGEGPVVRALLDVQSINQRIEAKLATLSKKLAPLRVKKEARGITGSGRSCDETNEIAETIEDIYSSLEGFERTIDDLIHTTEI